MRFILKRMLQIGFITYDWKPSFVTIPADTKVHYNGQNEYFYIFDVNSQAGDKFRIKADNDIIRETDFILSGVPYLFFEFTGNIYIDTTGAVNPQTFLYIRVLPEKVISIHKNKKKGSNHV